MLSNADDGLPPPPPQPPLFALIDRMNTLIGRAAAWALVVAIVISVMNALSRRIFSVSSNGWLEAQWYLFGIAFMLCAPWLLRENGHVRIDMLSQRLSVRTRLRLELFGHLAFLLPFVLLMIWLSGPMALRAITTGEMSPNEGGLPLWPAKGVIFLGFLLLALQGLSETWRTIGRLRAAPSGDPG